MPEIALYQSKNQECNTEGATDALIGSKNCGPSIISHASIPDHSLHICGGRVNLRADNVKILDDFVLLVSAKRQSSARKAKGDKREN